MVVDGVLGSCDDDTVGERFSTSKGVTLPKSACVDINRSWVSSCIDNSASGGGVGIERGHGNDESWLADELVGESTLVSSDGKT